MKVHLMYRHRDFALRAHWPSNAADLTKDLELDSLFQAMAGGDQFLLDVAKTGVLVGLRDPDAIRYRQAVLNDCFQAPGIVKELYAIAVDAIERERKVWGWTSELPQSALHRATEVLQIFVGQLKKLRHIANVDGGRFTSDAFRRFFAMLATELDDQYLAIVEQHLKRLEFRRGVLMSAELGQGLKGFKYVLRKLPDSKETWLAWLQNWLGITGKDQFVYEVADRDEAGFRALSELRSQGIGHVAAALAQSTDHILSFFQLLRLEVGFYLGCMNLRDRLVATSEPVCFPEPMDATTTAFGAHGLYDPCLSLAMQDRSVGNDVAGDEKTLFVVTGANRGGKSTFLRSAGLAQLMMQAGMFVAADAFRANVCKGVFTHFKREEDVTMKSGKLDEELSRMSSLVDKLSSGSLVLMNESFGSTNEREGSEIGRQIVRALLESGMKVIYVTHLFDLARSFYTLRLPYALFLRAERLEDGRRTFRLLEDEPLPTSFGQDLYQRIFPAASEPCPL